MSHLLPVRLYLKVFAILLALLFVNIGLAHLPFSSFWLTFLLIAVSTLQVVLVALFFMELIHEDKFYSFIFGSALLFILLFMIVSLVEIRNRGVFNPLEDTKMMRQIDQNGNFSPATPKTPPTAGTGAVSPP